MEKDYNNIIIDAFGEVIERNPEHLTQPYE